MWILIEQNKSNSAFTVEWWNHERNLNYFIYTKDKSCGITSAQLTELSCAHMLLIRQALSYTVTSGDYLWTRTTPSRIDYKKVAALN